MNDSHWRSWFDHILVGGADECWPYTASVNKAGYPNTFESRKRVWAHRVIASLTEDVRGRIVHHRCENKRCLNPAHLHIFDSQSEHLKDHWKRR